MAENTENTEKKEKKEKKERKRRGMRVPAAIRLVITVVLVIAALLAGFYGGRAWANRGKPELSAKVIETQVANCSDLATADLQYSGIVHFQQGEIPVITKKAFNMAYTANVKAGVDLTQAKVTVEGRTIDITLPKAKLLSVEIDPASLEFYDNSFALFNWQKRTDTAAALESAEEDANKKIDETSLLDAADAHAIEVVEALISPLADDEPPYKLKVHQ